MEAERQQPQLDSDRFRELVFYICNLYDSDVLGAVRLNKALYFADMMWFALTGKPLTGEKYVKNNFGPVAADLENALGRLKADGRIREAVRQFSSGAERREFVTDGGSNESCFTADEREVIDKATLLTIRHTAQQLSEFSHHRIWQAAEMGEVLPYETVFHMYPPPVSEETYRWAVEEIKSGAYSR